MEKDTRCNLFKPTVSRWDIVAFSARTSEVSYEPRCELHGDKLAQKPFFGHLVSARSRCKMRKEGGLITPNWSKHLRRTCRLLLPCSATKRNLLSWFRNDSTQLSPALCVSNGNRIRRQILRYLR